MLIGMKCRFWQTKYPEKVYTIVSEPVATGEDVCLVVVDSEGKLYATDVPNVILLSRDGSPGLDYDSSLITLIKDTVERVK